MLEHIQEKDATFCHQRRSPCPEAGRQRISCHLTGWYLKQSTEAIIGTSASLMLNDYHFQHRILRCKRCLQKCRLHHARFRRSPDQKTAVLQCHKFYALCDHSKFNVVSSVTFAPFARGNPAYRQLPRKIIRVQRIYGSVNSLHPTKKDCNGNRLRLPPPKKRYSSSCV